MAQTFKAAIVQHPPVFLNLNESVTKAIQRIEEAAQGGASIVAFPETWLPGYPVWLDFAPKAAVWDHPPAKTLFRALFNNSLKIGSEPFKRLQKAAKKAKVHVIMGAHEQDRGTLYNTIVYFHKNGEEFKIHRKLVPTYTERLIWGRGDGSTLNVMETEHGVVGALVCWEHWMPLLRSAMHSKQELLHVAQWPSVKEYHQVASRHYAFEGQCYVLAAGVVLKHRDVREGAESVNEIDADAMDLLKSMPGEDKDYILDGGSAIIDPVCDYVEGPLFGESKILYGDIDPDKTIEGRLFIDTDGHYSRPDIFQLKVNNKPLTSVEFEE